MCLRWHLSEIRKSQRSCHHIDNISFSNQEVPQLCCDWHAHITVCFNIVAKHCCLKTTLSRKYYHQMQVTSTVQGHILVIACVVITMSCTRHCCMNKYRIHIVNVLQSSNTFTTGLQGYHNMVKYSTIPET